jgi:hypothetical protein
MPHSRHDTRGVDHTCFKCNDPEQEAAEMTTEQKRMWLVALYPDSKTWAAKVARMPDNQVIAIYLRKQNQPKERAS